MSLLFFSERGDVVKLFDPAASLSSGEDQDLESSDHDKSKNEDNLSAFILDLASNGVSLRGGLLERRALCASIGVEDVALLHISPRSKLALQPFSSHTLLCKVRTAFIYPLHWPSINLSGLRLTPWYHIQTLQLMGNCVNVYNKGKSTVHHSSKLRKNTLL